MWKSAMDAAEPYREELRLRLGLLALDMQRCAPGGEEWLRLAALRQRRLISLRDASPLLRSIFFDHADPSGVMCVFD